ncbi:hypothetical protein SH139x_003747 [Planctomycetaceae bacterium SH139]
MSKERTVSGPSTSPRLIAWQQANRVANAHARTKRWVTGLCLALLVVFVALAVWPLGAPRVYFLTVSDANSRERASSQRLHAVEDFVTLRQTAWQLRNASLSRWTEEVRAIRQSAPDTVLVYLAGTPVWDSTSIRLCLQPAAGFESQQPIDLGDMVQQLGDVDRPALLIVDAEIDPFTATGSLPEYLGWRLRQHLEAITNSLANPNLRVIVDLRVREVAFDDRAMPAPARLAEDLLTAFGSETDRNGDGTISFAEFTQAILRSPATSGQLAGWREMFPSEIDDLPNVKLAPSLAKIDPPLQATAVSAKRAKLVAPIDKANDNETVTAATVTTETTYALLAPTAAAAVAFGQLDLHTQQAASAAQLLDQLDAIAELAEGAGVATQWVATHASQFQVWPLTEVVTPILESELAWKHQRTLLRAHLDHQRLLAMGDLTPAQQAQLQAGQMHLHHATRALLSPVRLSNQQYVVEQAHVAAAAMSELQASLAWRREAEQLVQQVVENEARWRRLPVIAASFDEDLVVKLLTGTAEIADALTSEQHFDQTELTRLQALLRANENKLSALRAPLQPELGTADGLAQAAGDDAGGSSPAKHAKADNIQVLTQVRLARAQLLAELVREKQPVESRRKLIMAGKQAQAMLLKEPLPAESTTAALDTFLYLAMAHSGHVAVANMYQQPDVEAAVTAMVTRLADYAIAANFDATPEERQRLLTIHNRCALLAKTRGFDVSAWQFTAHLLFARLAGRLEEYAESELIIVLKSPFNERVGQIEIEAEPQGLLFSSLAGSEAGDASASLVTLREPATGLSTKENSRDHSQLSSSNQPVRTVRAVRSSDRQTGELVATGTSPEVTDTFRISVRRVAGFPLPQAIHVRLNRGGVRERLSVRLPATSPPLAALRVAKLDQPVTSASGQTTWAMVPNQTAVRKLYLRSEGNSPRKLAVRLLALNSVAEVPKHSMSPARTEVWLAEQGGVVELAKIASVLVSNSEETRLVFPPQVLKPTDPLVSLQQLVCEVEETSSGMKQLLPLAPIVVRPFGLVTPNVKFNHLEKRIGVRFQRTEAMLAEDAETPLSMRCELFNLDNGEVAATAEVALTGEITPWREIAAEGLRGANAGLRISVLGWPNAFVYQIPLNQTKDAITTTDQVLQINFEEPKQIVALQPGAHLIAPRALALISDDHFRYGRDVVRVGVDMNGDRLLQDEPLVELRTPVEIRFDWHGVDPQGQVVLHCTVAAQKFPLSTRALVNGRYPLLAELRHGGRSVWNVGPVVVIDSERPRVAELELLSPLPAELGKPVTVRVNVDDKGLSGPALVELGWAEGGDLSFTAEVKKTSGQRLANGQWEATVPTAKRNAGPQQLLVRVLDRAGNESEIKVLDVTLMTAEEIALRRQEATTAVQGLVAYVSKPVAGLEVSLTPVAANPAGDESSAAGGSEGSEKTDATDPGAATDTVNKGLSAVQTDSAGRFVFPRVKRGQYRLTVSGRYLGSDRERSLTIEVDPPTPTTVPRIRID